MAVCLLIVVGNCLLKMHFELATLPREPQLTRAMGIRPSAKNESMSCEQETTQPAGDDHVEQDTTKRVAITVAPTIKDLKRDGIQRIAITVAPTADELLPFAVLNVLENLPDEWRVQIFHSPEISSFIKENALLLPYFKAGRLISTPTIHPRMNHRKYSKLLKSKSFWEQVLGEYVLTFQTDSVLCSKSPHSINDFLQFDWVGAPWKTWPRLGAGNGGLSFRRKSKIMETIAKCQLRVPHAEDLWFAKCFLKLSKIDSAFRVKLPSPEVAKNFSVESIPSLEPFGVHKPWAFLDAPELERLSQFCPELRVITPTNLS